MKKLLSLALALALTATMAVAAFADNTTTLTTTVPAATYTLHIPADQEIPFGTTTAKIGNVTVTDGVGFAAGKNLAVTVSWDNFHSNSVSTTIPFRLQTVADGITSDMQSGDVLKFVGNDSGSVSKFASARVVSYKTGNAYDADVTGINFFANSSSWGKALAGDYSATITFTAEVVSA